MYIKFEFHPVVKFNLEQTMKEKRKSRGNSSTLSLTSALDGGG
jgi:hypothetical protein